MFGKQPWPDFFVYYMYVNIKSKNITILTYWKVWNFILSLKRKLQIYDKVLKTSYSSWAFCDRYSSLVCSKESPYSIHCTWSTKKTLFQDFQEILMRLLQYLQKKTLSSLLIVVSGSWHKTCVHWHKKLPDWKRF